MKMKMTNKKLKAMKKVTKFQRKDKELKIISKTEKKKIASAVTVAGVRAYNLLQNTNAQKKTIKKKKKKTITHKHKKMKNTHK